jgi:hypothetical protein
VRDLAALGHLAIDVEERLLDLVARHAGRLELPRSGRHERFDIDRCRPTSREARAASSHRSSPR